jgi:hypothetical protein
MTTILKGLVVLASSVSILRRLWKMSSPSLFMSSTKRWWRLSGPLPRTSLRALEGTPVVALEVATTVLATVKATLVLEVVAAAAMLDVGTAAMGRLLVQAEVVMRVMAQQAMELQATVVVLAMVQE